MQMDGSRNGWDTMTPGGPECWIYVDGVLRGPEKVFTEPNRLFFAKFDELIEILGFSCFEKKKTKEVDDIAAAEYRYKDVSCALFSLSMQIVCVCVVFLCGFSCLNMTSVNMMADVSLERSFP